jgi:hypothetical protein
MPATYNGRPFPLFVAEQAREILSALAASTLDGDAPGTLEDLSALLSGDMRRAVGQLERAVADKLPPIRAADARNLANHDREIAREIAAYRDGRYSFVDVTDLAAEEGAPSETWEIVAGGTSRYEVRAVPRYEARRVGGVKIDANGNPRGNVEAWIVWDNEGNEQADDGDAVEALGLSERAAFDEHDARAVAAWLAENAPGRDPEPVFVVWDTERDEDARDGDRYSPLHECGRDDYDPADEDDARRAAEGANLEDYRDNAHGWPFAHNYAAEIEEWEAEDFAAAGFVVARHEPSGKVYAGIDGGGYSFLDAHWAPLLLRRMAKGGGYVRTSKGLRRVVK